MEEAEKTVTFSGENTINLVKQFIRYDIPFLLLGISSIGKSYSIIDMANRWRMPHSILYIGSEKPSNIEGLPRLVGRRSETGDMLEFFKPNWFPNSLLIASYVSSGKAVFDSYVETAYNGDKKGVLEGSNFRELNEIFEGLFQWKWLSTSTESQDLVLPKQNSASGGINKPFKVSRELLDEKELFEKTTENPNFLQKDEVRDMCLYLSTILGYGNFWLILDELDKVDEAEKDKYAPLLHIVRERTIKNFSMRTLNEGEGAGVPDKVQKGSYKNIKDRIDESIAKKFPLLDTRIIGIANATAGIEEALFRRFLHIIVEQVMMVSTPPQELMSLRNCLSEVASGVQQGQNQFLANLEFKLLQEVNLQWQFSFFPKLINKQDASNNFILRNLQKSISSIGIDALEKGFENNPAQTTATLLNSASDSALFKIVRNNFGVDDEISTSLSVAFQSKIYSCLVQEVLGSMSYATDIVSEGKESADIGSNALDSEAFTEIISEALEMMNQDPVKASKQIIATNISEFNSIEQGNANIQEYITNNLLLIEYSKGTLVEDHLFTGILTNAYYSAMYSKQSYDFKCKMFTYINEFSLLAQLEGFSWNKSDKSIRKSALELLCLSEDTRKVEEKGISDDCYKLVLLNKEFTLNAFQMFSKQGELGKAEDVVNYFKSTPYLSARILQSQVDTFTALQKQSVVIEKYSALAINKRKTVTAN